MTKAANLSALGTNTSSSGVLEILSGGTGQTTANSSFNALAPSQTSNTGKYLTTNGTDTSWAAVTQTTFSAGTTGFTPNTATSGTVTLAGTLNIANGGTGTSTAQGAMNTFAGVVTSGSYLRGNGTNVVMSTIQAADVPTLNQNTTGSAATVTGNATGSTFGFNSGYGSVATAYGCRAWVNFNGVNNPPTIRASGNVTSITDLGTGYYQINFTTAIIDGNYCTNVTGSVATSSSTPVPAVATNTAPATTNVRITFNIAGSGQFDQLYTNVAIFR